MDSNNMDYSNGGMYASQPADGGRKKGRAWIWVVVAVVIACAAVATVLAVGRTNTTGNAGVVALYQYYQNQQTEFEKRQSNAQKEIGEKFKTEPFEINAEMDVKSDLMNELGLPVESVQVDAAVKYDLKDLGVQLNAMGGFVNVDAYVIGDEFVAEFLGQAGSTKIDLPIEADLDDNMTLDQRFKAFLPFLPEDDALLMDVLQQVALSVPDKYTETSKKDVYSPMDDDDIEMSVITTSLDADALREVIENFEENMKKNEKLTDELQDMIDEFTAYFDLDDVDLEQGLEDMVNDSDDIDDILIEWSVYQRDGSYVGVHIYMENEDMDVIDYTDMCEFDGQHAWKKIVFSTEDMVEDASIIYEFNGDEMTFKSEIAMESSIGEVYEQNMKMTIDAAFLVEKEDDGEYFITMDADYNIEDMTGKSGLPDNRLPMSISAEVECLFGDDLGTLKDSRDWGDIYDMEWGDLEDIFSVESLMPGMM